MEDIAYPQSGPPCPNRNPTGFEGRTQSGLNRGRRGPGMASRIRFHGSVIIAPQRARKLVARMERGEIRGPANADITFPDSATGRRVARSRWLHPGYELPRAIDQPRELSTGPIDALRPGGSTTTIAPCLTRSKR